MPARSGRIEKRIRLEVPVQVSSLNDPGATERTTTENVCSLGMRIMSQQFRVSDERLMISSLIGDLRTLAQVVNCQRLPDGRFGVGLRFQGQPVKFCSSSWTWTARSRLTIRSAISKATLYLKLAARVMEETFRDSGVTARLGGDAFAVLAIEAAGHSEPRIRTRLFELLKSVSAEQSRYEMFSQFRPRTIRSAQPHIPWRIDDEGRRIHVRTEATPIKIAFRHGNESTGSIGSAVW
jgi:hypothetical protein